MDNGAAKRISVTDNRRVWKGSLACLLLISAFLSGCSREGERPVVDFARIHSVEGSSQKSREELPALRVAVGAMISPQETYVDCRALLNLCGEENRAFTDQESNTGRLVPTFWLTRMGQSPESYFGKIIYTYSHDNSILAVSRGLVDGAAVDSLIWEYYESTNPALTASARVVKCSEPYPIPPIVASRYFPEHVREQVGPALFNMHHDPESRQILVGLKIDRFIPASQGMV